MGRTDLRRYTTDHAVGEQLRQNGAALELSAEHNNWVQTTLGRAVPATVYEVEIPDPPVILTSDGVHDQVPADVLAELVGGYQADPRALVDALVAVARPNGARPREEDHRDDATTVVLLRRREMTLTFVDVRLILIVSPTSMEGRD